MVEAVRTTQSTFGIWAIIAVAMICLGVWLVSIYIADGHQTRLSRQRRLDAPRPALSEAGAEASASAIPGQRRESGQPEPQAASEAAASESIAARGRHARPPEYYAAADYYAVADYKAAEKRPAGNAGTRNGEAGGAEAGGAEAGGQADAPTVPDLPAQAAATGRHAMPAQRTGDSDRAERSYAGPDATSEDDQDQR